MSYTLKEHKHRLAYWAASNAAHRHTKGLNIENGKKLIEKINLHTYIDSPDTLPQDLDKAHAKWRNVLVQFSEELHCSYKVKIKKDEEIVYNGISHGTAAKLINVYLKVILTCGGYENHEKVKQLHPPIDSLLLESLLDSEYKEILKKGEINKNTRWTKLTSDKYENIIKIIKDIQKKNNEPLWMIEKYWRPEEVTK